MKRMFMMALAVMGDALIGDVVEAKVMKAKKNYAYARLEKVVTPSSFRVEPKCQFARSCGGCQLQAMDYAQQLAFKNRKVKNNMLFPVHIAVLY